MFDSIPLGEIAKVEMGQSPDSNYVHEGLDNGLPFLQGNAEFGEVNPSAKYSCSAPMKKCSVGDILISVRAPVGEINVADRAYCIGRGLAAISFSDVSPTIAGKLIEAARHKLRIVAQGSTFEAINKNDLLSLLVSWPKAKELQTLDEIFNTTDTQIRQTEAIIAKLQQVKQGLLHDLLTRGIDANGQLRPPRDQAPELYKESPLGWIPREWEVQSLESISEIRSGATPSRSLFARYFYGGSFNWVKTLDLNEGTIEKTAERITDLALKETSCFLLPKGSVLIAMYGGWEQIGRTAILGKQSATNQAICALEVHGELNPEFLLRAVQFGRHRWKKVAASTRKDPNITKNDIENFEIAFPSCRREQDYICSRYRALIARIHDEGAALNKLKKQKSGLMDDLLTGRVRVNELLKTA